MHPLEFFTFSKGRLSGRTNDEGTKCDDPVFEPFNSQFHFGDFGLFFGHIWFRKCAIKRELRIGPDNCLEEAARLQDANFREYPPFQGLLRPFDPVLPG